MTTTGDYWVTGDSDPALAARVPSARALNCDQQRAYAASIWRRWNEQFEVGARYRAGVTIKSYTRLTLASAEQRLSGPRLPLPATKPARA